MDHPEQTILEMAPPAYGSHNFDAASYNDVPLAPLPPAKTGNSYRDYEANAPHDPHGPLNYYATFTPKLKKEPWYRRMVYTPRWYHLVLWATVIALLIMGVVLAAMRHGAKSAGQVVSSNITAPWHTVTVFTTPPRASTIATVTTVNVTVHILPTTTTVAAVDLTKIVDFTITSGASALSTVAFGTPVQAITTDKTPTLLPDHCTIMYDKCPKDKSMSGMRMYLCGECLRLCREGKLLGELSKTCFP